MRIININALNGPNVYHYKPVLKVTVELEEYTEVASCDVPGLKERLLQILPGLESHHCSLGHHGGFVERLVAGTYFAHIAEHIAIELSQLAEMKIGYGKTVYGGEEGRYDIYLRYECEEASKFIARHAVELLVDAAKGEVPEISKIVAEARSIKERNQLGPSTQAIIDAAIARNIPWRRVNDQSLVQLGYGCKRRFVQATESHTTSSVAVSIASDKNLTKKILDEAGIPVPFGVVIEAEDEMEAAIRTVGAPLAIKPLDGNQGRGISLNISSHDEAKEAFMEAKKVSSKVIVESYLRGRDYRVLVVDGEVVAANERTRASVRGNGELNIRQLVERENNNPLRGEGHSKPLTKLKLDPVFLRRCGLSSDSIPKKGETVFLCATANLSTGGTSKDVLKLIHPDIARACSRAAKAIGLNICGVDIIHPDISKPWPESGAGIVELNAAPGIRMHEFPTEGVGRKVGKVILAGLYPESSDGRIPIISVTGTNGKTTVTKMISHILSSRRIKVGMTSTGGVYIDGKCIVEGDTTGYQSTRTVLSDPTVEAAVLEVARGGIMRSGLAYDWSDIGIITNIQNDHFGQNNIENLDDLLHVKSLVAERVKQDGTLILNADDPLLAALPDKPSISKIKREIIFFSQQGKNPVLSWHLIRGGTAIYTTDGWIVEARGNIENKIMPIAQVPQSLGGTIDFQVANTLAAIAGARAYGISMARIRSALRTFGAAQNPGRFNWFRVRNGYVLIDYGHNPGAFEAMNGFLEHWNGKKTGVVGLPGDRSDRLLEAGAIAAAKCFDKIIIREDEDRRGRAPGETAEIICKSIKKHFPQKDCLTVLSSSQALRKAVAEMEHNELVVMFYEELGEVQNVLTSFDAHPLSVVEPSYSRLIRENGTKEVWQ